MSEKLVTGVNLEQTAAFIDLHYAHDLRDRIYAHLPAELRERLPRVRATDWYPLADQVALLVAMASVAASPAEASANARALGRHISGATTSTFMRLLLKVTSPQTFLRKASHVWPRMFSFGSFHADLTGCGSKVAVIVMRGVDGFDYVEDVSAGWIEGMFAAMGCANASVTPTAIEREPPGTAYRFNIEWVGEARAAPAHGRADSLGARRWSLWGLV